MSTDISVLSALQQRTTASPDIPEERPRNPQEAAAQFEKVLVQQFVDVMTEDMFSSSLAGEDGPQWMGSQRDSNRDAMTEVLTDHIVESGDLGLRELLLKRWGVADDGTTDEEAASSLPTTPLPAGVSDG